MDLGSGLTWTVVALRSLVPGLDLLMSAWQHGQDGLPFANRCDAKYNIGASCK